MITIHDHADPTLSNVPVLSSIKRLFWSILASVDETGTNLLSFLTCFAELLFKTSSPGFPSLKTSLPTSIFRWWLRFGLHGPGLSVIRTPLNLCVKICILQNLRNPAWWVAHHQNQMAVSGNSSKLEAPPWFKLNHVNQHFIHHDVCKLRNFMPCYTFSSQLWPSVNQVAWFALQATSFWAVLVPRRLRYTHLSLTCDGHDDQHPIITCACV